MVTSEIACAYGLSFGIARNSHYPAPWSLDYWIVPNALAAENAYFDHIKNIKVIRAPKLDEWWIQREFGANDLDEWRVKLKDCSSRKVVCVFASMISNDGRIVKHEKEMLRETLISLKREALFIFKFHPHDKRCGKDVEFIQQWIPEDVHWVECDLNLIQLTRLGEIMVVIGLTESPGDVIIADIPIITFYDRADKTEQRDFSMSSFKCDKGEETLYEHFDFVIHADNAGELYDAIQLGARDSSWKECRRRFMEFLPNMENASKEISNILLQKMH